MATFNAFLTVDLGVWVIGMGAVAFCLIRPSVRRAVRDLWDVRS
jgi:hypothetical protein